MEAPEKYDHISTSEIEKDIADTEREINDFQDEQDVLMRNPQQHKLRLYMLTGKISSRQKFIDRIKLILNYRHDRTSKTVS